MTPRVRLARSAVALGAVLLLGGCLVGCSGSPGQQLSELGTVSESSLSETRVVARTIPGELSTVGGELAVGDEVEVLIDTPGVDWAISNSNPEAVEVVESDDAANPRLVRIVGIAPGFAEITFDGGSDELGDGVSITVVEE